MTRQWHNTKIKKKPYLRFNPSLKESIAPAYRCWFVFVGVLSVLIGLGLVGCSGALKHYDSDLKDQVFHIWVAVPLVISGILSLVCRILKTKKLVIFYVVIVIIITVVCACGAIVSGIHFWMDGWKLTRYEVMSGRCAMQDEKCLCKNIHKSLLPTLVDDCAVLKVMVNLVIVEVVLSVAGFIMSVVGLYVSFMSLCCAPWVYTEWYDERYDPDMSKKQSVSQINVGTNVGTYNKAYN